MSRVLRGSRLVVVAAALLGLLAGCAVDDDDVLDVFAAASLTDAFGELADEFEATNPGVEVRLNFAGSSTLREQLLDGAEADVFASANMAIMDELVGDGAVAGPPQIAARNVLTLAVPVDNPSGVTGLDDLARPELLVGVCARGVPCGDLAARLLDAVGIEAAADTAEPDVRSLARRLVDRELDVALVYASDVVADPDGLRAVAVDVEMPTTDYPIAVVEADDDAAGAFVDFVLGPSGRAVLERWGFETP